MQERRFVIGSESVRQNVAAFIAKLPFDKPVLVVVGDYFPRRTLEQNARLWALHTAAGNFVGCTAEEMHEDMLRMVYGYKEVKMPSGHVERVPLKRSSQRNKKEFAEFMEKVEAFYISELGVYLEQAA
jgi:hypothetical protein